MLSASKSMLVVQKLSLTSNKTTNNYIFRNIALSYNMISLTVSLSLALSLLLCLFRWTVERVHVGRSRQQTRGGAGTQPVTAVQSEPAAAARPGQSDGRPRLAEPLQTSNHLLQKHTRFSIPSISDRHAGTPSAVPSVARVYLPSRVLMTRSR